ncbi:hypothetical protein EKK58_07975 [Candidatus Dependentiae bacterium]|nr:MAG: hypothetical protein EKK58_07975 [Candidatus Dependentiae bacterium]
MNKLKVVKVDSEAEKLLEKFARKNMVQWNQESFKRTHSRLHKSIIEALNEALRIHDVVGRSEQLVAFLKWVGDGYDFENNAEKIVKEYIDEGN